MNTYNVAVKILPRPGLLDPQGKAILDALHALEHRGVRAVHVGKAMDLEIAAPDPESALEAARTMCQVLLANPVTEDYSVGLAS